MNSQAAFSTRDPGVRKPDADGSSLSRGLGLFSLGLGLTELAAPEALARAIGVDPDGRTSTALRVLGMREVISGLGVLAQPRRALPLWARVVGDAIDLGLVAWAARSRRTSGQRLVAAFAAVAGVAALDVIASRRVARANRRVIDPVIYSVTINRPVAEVYGFWRKLENLPRFMDVLESVNQTPNGRSHWVARLPVGGTIGWDAEITEDRPGELIAWRTVEGSLLVHHGEVSFARAPGRDMTEVRVVLELGMFGAAASPLLAKLLTRPQIKGDLRRLKQVLETGEIVRSDASIHRGRHPAQPSAELPPSVASAALPPIAHPVSPAPTVTAPRPSPSGHTGAAAHPVDTEIPAPSPNKGRVP
jgi:uncharacterized membrane protein